MLKAALTQILVTEVLLCFCFSSHDKHERNYHLCRKLQRPLFGAPILICYERWMENINKIHHKKSVSGNKNSLYLLSKTYADDKPAFGWKQNYYNITRSNSVLKKYLTPPFPPSIWHVSSVAFSYCWKMVRSCPYSTVQLIFALVMQENDTEEICRNSKKFTRSMNLRLEIFFE